ncbi:S8 family serine peptidase [Cellulophaga sp. HaHaR_3_176]|uniref:S8 family serine peptidase n=1 Tax=Cellulophaga sp. HaHaR_3_176 TaxID=1942464 RepID=UPI001C1F85EA|nr:S8 family serine peptidase [Cellulophaga sp. HaHaR_3_176]QWX83740.1 S8 family serine peptidase [Cellulophaga sp. HaHaR_3_176]
MFYYTTLKQYVFLCLTLFLVVGCVSVSNAQSKQQVKKIQSKYKVNNLLKVRENLNFEFIQKEKSLVNFAKANGLKLSETLENGNEIALVDIGEDGTPIYYSTFRNSSSEVSRANALYEGGLLDLGISGEGMQVGLWDSGSALLTHQEFNNRAQNTDSAEEISSHATMVLGAMISSGIKQKARGVAYSATAISSDWRGDKVEVANAAANGLLLSNHSYGIRPDFIPDWYFGAYLKVSQDWDKIMYNAPYYLMVTAAGNSQKQNFNAAPIYGKSTDGFDLLLGFSTSKNGINVAGVDTSVDVQGNLKNAQVAAYSSHGPTDDGRIKPDIAGCGANIFSTEAANDKSYDTYTGTSMAAPGITSAMLLLQEYYNRLNSNFMRAATLKGLVLHTADDVSAPGPDYKMGWGVMNAKNAAELIVATEYSSLIIEEELKDNETYTITVDAKEGEALIASISWTDPAGNFINKGLLNNTTAALVNDLDIVVTKNDEVYLPWKLNPSNVNADAVKGDNKVDPFEKVEVENAAGTYTITVKHKGAITNNIQDFSLIVSGAAISNCKVETPKDFSTVSPEEDAIQLNWNIADDAFFEVQYKVENTDEWSTVFVDANEIKLQHLTNGNKYVVRVRTNCTENIFSDFSEELVFEFKGEDTLAVFETEKEELSIIDEKLKFTVHPNPTTDQINIDGQLSKEAYYSIVSSTGTMLKKGRADYKAINVDDLSTGFYSLTIFDDGEQQSMKFIKN